MSTEMTCYQSAHGDTTFIHRHLVHKFTKLRTSLQSTSTLIKTNDIEILVSSVYNPPNAPLNPINLETLTNSAD